MTTLLVACNVVSAVCALALFVLWGRETAEHEQTSTELAAALDYVTQASSDLADVSLYAQHLGKALAHSLQNDHDAAWAVISEWHEEIRT